MSTEGPDQETLRNENKLSLIIKKIPWGAVGGLLGGIVAVITFVLGNMRDTYCVDVYLSQGNLVLNRVLVDGSFKNCGNQSVTVDRIQSAIYVGDNGWIILMSPDKKENKDEFSATILARDTKTFYFRFEMPSYELEILRKYADEIVKPEFSFRIKGIKGGDAYASMTAFESNKNGRKNKLSTYERVYHKTIWHLPW